MFKLKGPEVTISETVFLNTHWWGFMIVLLQLLYMCGKCKFLERMPRKRGYRRQHQASA